jgi:hypothetical protein
MKIGIFGDSFACHNPYLLEPWVSKEQATERKSWIDYIEIEKNINVANHAVRGSGLYYSYAQFKKYQRTYDKIIFVITDWGRLWAHNATSTHSHIPGFAHCEFKLKHCEDEDDRKVFQAAYDYYVYLQNNSQEIDLHKLMLADIVRLRSDALLLPAFENDISCFVPDWEGPNLKAIADIDNHFFKINRGTPDLKHCHFNDENNLIFSKQIIDWIDNGTKVKIDLKDYQAPTKPVDYYFSR